VGTSHSATGAIESALKHVSPDAHWIARRLATAGGKTYKNAAPQRNRHIPIGNSQVLLAAVYRSPGRAWSDADITELLSFRRKSILAGDLNAKHPFWNSVVSNP
jgi:hypothetical protein